jgi:biotin carboxylase
MLRGAENPDEIFVRIEFHSADDARTFQDKVRNSDVLQKVTVKVPPTVAEMADQATY